MELQEVISHRRMVRSFDRRPIDVALVDRLVTAATRAPSAGNTGGTAWLSLNGPEQTRQYWDHTTTPEWRRCSARWPGLSRAPVILLSLCAPHAYVDRYGKPDKAGSGLGPITRGEGGMAAWPVPYWFGDAAFETLLLLLGIAEARLAACFLGNFRGEAELLASLGVPEDWRLFGAVLVGHPGGEDPRSPSLARPRPEWRRLHSGRWLG